MTSTTDARQAPATPATSAVQGCEGLRVDDRNRAFKSLRAARRFAQGERLIDLAQAELRETPDFATIDLHDGHALHPVARYINHSCAPSARIDLTGRAVVALRDILAGEEITFDYLRSERQIVAPFDCRCGAEQCVGRIE